MVCSIGNQSCFQRTSHPNYVELSWCIKAAWATQIGLVKPLYKQKYRISEDKLTAEAGGQSRLQNHLMGLKGQSISD